MKKINNFDNKSRNIYAYIIAAVALAFSLGCLGPALDAIYEAKDAIHSAEEAEAKKYAPVEMAGALANYEIAEESFDEATASGNRRARSHAIEARNQAVAAREKALKEKKKLARRKAIYAPPPQEPLDEVTTKDKLLVKRRYVASARRRIRNVAMNSARGSADQGSLDAEVWIAPDGRVVQILLVEGDPSSRFTQQVLEGLSSVRLAPFPKGMGKDYIKIGVKIGSGGKTGRHTQ